MPVIGVISRSSISIEGHKTDIIYDDVVKSIEKNGGTCIGIVLNENYKYIVNMCDGIIIQGGDSVEDYELDAIKYLYNIDKPVLGICLGMQIMSILFDGEMIDIKNHKKKLDYVHSIKVNKNSKLYNILKNDIVKVNSRHKSCIKSTKLDISAISNDGIIEAVESKNKKFFIGVQWHPESMTSYDINQNNIFKNFIKICS